MGRWWRSTCCLPYHPGLRSPNELCRLWQTRALVEYGTLDINQALRDYGPVGDLSVKDGQVLPVQGAAAVLRRGARLRGAARRGRGLPATRCRRCRSSSSAALFLTVLPTLVLLLLRAPLPAELPVARAVADGVTVTYALGSLAFSYSLLFMSHQTTAVLLFGAFYALWRCAARRVARARAMLVAGACAGATVAAEYTGARWACSALVLYARRSRCCGAQEPMRPRGSCGWAARAGLAVLGALPFVVALMLYHQAAFGHPLETGLQTPERRGLPAVAPGRLPGHPLPGSARLLRSPSSRPLRGLFIALAVPAARAARAGAASAERSRASAGVAARSSGFGRRARRLHVLHLVVHLRLVGLDDGAAAPHGAGALPAAARGPGAGAPARGDTAGRLLGAASRPAVRGLHLITGVATFINYVPDDVSNAFLGLAVPLLKAGYLPPTVLSFWGIPQPFAGIPLLIGLLALAGWVFLRLGAAEVGIPAPTVLFGAMLTATLLFSLQAVTTNHAKDQGAVNFLESQWLTPPGRAVPFWPDPRS